MKFILYTDCFEGEAFYYAFPSRENVIAAIVPDYGKDKFYRLPIYDISKIREWKSQGIFADGEYHILVASNWWNYQKLKGTFNGLGLKEFEDYSYYLAYGKKIAVVTANCYGIFYNDFLRQSKDFCETYFLYDTPWLGSGGDCRIPDELLNRCDLYIHQDIQKENSIGEWVSDEYILPRLKKECRKVTVPNLVGFGWAFYPKSIYTPEFIPKKFHQTRVFYRNKFLEECYQKGLSFGTIEKNWYNPDIITREEMIKLQYDLEDTVTKFKKREEKWDIKIIDYIMAHYKDEKMFEEDRHPTYKVFHEICCRLGKFLGLKDWESVQPHKERVDCTMVEEFVMPCVKKALGMNFQEKCIRKRKAQNGVLSEDAMDVREYIREYMFWFHERLIPDRPRLCISAIDVNKEEKHYLEGDMIGAESGGGHMFYKMFLSRRLCECGGKGVHQVRVVGLGLEWEAGCRRCG